MIIRSFPIKPESEVAIHRGIRRHIEICSWFRAWVIDGSAIDFRFIKPAFTAGPKVKPIEWLQGCKNQKCRGRVLLILWLLTPWNLSDHPCNSDQSSLWPKNKKREKWLYHIDGYRWSGYRVTAEFRLLIGQKVFVNLITYSKRVIVHMVHKIFIFSLLRHLFNIYGRCIQSMSVDYL